MIQTAYTNQPATTIFDAWADNPSGAIACDLARIDQAKRRFRQSKEMQHAIELLDGIENLRRFVLVRRTLAKGLAQPTRRGGEPMGRQLCDALRDIIGDVPKLAESCNVNGQYRMERDSRRAIACLIFLGSLDTDFI